MKTLVRFEKWDQILDGKSLPQINKPREDAWYYWARGLALASKGNHGAAADAAAQMRKTLDDLKARTRAVPPQMEAARVELEGYIQARAGSAASGLDLLRKAADMEAALLYTEPPAYPRPVVEILGKTALDLRDFKTAETAYRQALAMEPDSGRALWGIAQALFGQGKKAEGDKILVQFMKSWSTVDSDLPEIRAARKSMTSQQ